MASVGILSMQRIVNYGSFLQAYALKMIIEELGHEVQFVDYRLGEPLVFNKDKHSIKIFSKLIKVLEVLKYDVSLKQKIQYLAYKKNFSKKYHTVLGINSKKNYTPSLDILIIGSDEVFNCIQKNINVGYSLELFGKNNKAKRLISYAASFGNTTLKKLCLYKKSQEIGNLLKEFDSISVRDSNSQYIVEKLTGLVPESHFDPVLIYDYMKKCDEIPTLKKKENYIILYAYANRISDDEASWIRNYAALKNCKIYAIGGVQKCADNFINCTPFEVLAYFKNSEAVITDTFHGTIFSIVTQKSFATLIRKSDSTSYGNEEKITDLLRKLCLQNRMSLHISAVKNILNENITYDPIMKIIEEERIKSNKYFIKQLKEKKMLNRETKVNNKAGL